ncbi:MAG TPA: hypothetical protein PKK69_01430 [Ferruginibacter sp.]|nr:hypothetical protein [Ferruginibacter sp.]
MQELINRLTEKAGLSADQASKAIDTVKDFIKEKFPMVAGAVDNVFSNQPAAGAEKVASGATGIMDKISDVIPGEAGEKVEQFAKQAADKAEDLFDEAKEKISGLFNKK